MAKIGIEYADVARIAEGLVARGLKPTNRLVQAETGGASMSSVHRHLKAWLAARPPVEGAAPELPAVLQRAIQEELGRVQAAARVEIEEQLAAARQEAEDLARESERVQADNETLHARYAELSAERDRLQGRAAQQVRDLELVQQKLEADLTALQQRLDAERTATQQQLEGERQAVTAARLRAENQEKQANASRQECERLHRALETERTGRMKAENALGRSEAALEELRKQVAQMMAQNDRLEAERHQLRLQLETERKQGQEQLDAERAARGAAQTELAGVTAQAKASELRAADLQRREDALREELRRREDALEQLRAAERERVSKAPRGSGR